MDPEELNEFQEIFASVDISDPIELRQWFNEYPELTMQEQCEITRRSAFTIRKWRRRAGLRETFLVELDDRYIVSIRKAPDYRCPPDKMPKIDVPTDWYNNRGWIIECLDNLGISKKKLSRIIGCQPRKVSKAYIKAKNYTPPPQSLLIIINEEE